MSANMILLKTQYLWLKHVYCILITHTLLLNVGGRYLWRGPAAYLNPKYVNLNLNLNRHFIMIFLQIELWFRTIFSCLLLPGDQPTTERGKGGNMEDSVWCLVSGVWSASGNQLLKREKVDWMEVKEDFESRLLSSPAPQHWGVYIFQKFYLPTMLKYSN